MHTAFARGRALLTATLLLATPAGATDFCGGTVPLPADAVVVSQPDGSLVVYDQGTTARMSNKVKYTCSCDGEGAGPCNPTWDGSQAGCVSMTCSLCTLHREEVSAVSLSDAGLSPDLDLAYGTCTDFTWSDEGALADRVAQVEAGMAARGITATQAGSDLIAPPGWTWRVEEVGGRTLVSPTPDPASAPLASGGKAKCKCEGDGKCSWQGIVCASNGYPDACDAGCAITVRGAVVAPDGGLAR